MFLTWGKTARMNQTEMSDPVLMQETMVMTDMKRLGDENFQIYF